MSSLNINELIQHRQELLIELDHLRYLIERQKILFGKNEIRRSMMFYNIQSPYMLLEQSKMFIESSLKQIEHMIQIIVVESKRQKQYGSNRYPHSQSKRHR